MQNRIYFDSGNYLKESCCFISIVLINNLYTRFFFHYLTDKYTW